MASIADPRSWPPAADAPARAAAFHTLARESLAAEIAQTSDRLDARIRGGFRALIDSGEGRELAQVFESAPSADLYRHLWRQLARAEAPDADGAMAIHVFALPVTVVAGVEAPVEAPRTLRCVLDDAAAIAAAMREHGALAGNQAFAIAPALAASEALDFEQLPARLAWTAMRDTFETDTLTPRDLVPAPIEITGGPPGVHLRFIVGVALAARGAELFGARRSGGWGIPVTRMLDRALASPGVTLLALPQAPRRLVAAVQHGRAAQREVSAQLFAAEALRKFRGTVGEPTAVISAHRCADAPAGGELRLSLSSVLDPRETEGFRCPLYRADQAGDVADMLLTLLRDCRVDDIRVLPGVHADGDPQTGLPLLFRVDALPGESVH